MSDDVQLLYLGHKSGHLPGVTPHEGLAYGESVEITDDVVRRLKRPSGANARLDFAIFLAGVYNANRKEPRWLVCGGMEPDPEPEDVESVDATPTGELVAVESGGTIEGDEPTVEADGVTEERNHDE